MSNGIDLICALDFATVANTQFTFIGVEITHSLKLIFHLRQGNPQETDYREDHVMEVDDIMEMNHYIIQPLISHVIAFSIIKTSILPAGL